MQGRKTNFFPVEYLFTSTSSLILNLFEEIGIVMADKQKFEYRAKSK